MKSPISACRRAFTLIEVLVVVAIIALLVSILIPALTRAKDQARRAVCAAHLHQDLLGINAYVNENRGLGPQRGWKSYTVSEWASEINGFGGQNTKILCNLGQLYKKWIGGQEDVLYCPSLLTKTKNFEGTPGPGSGGGWKTLWDANFTYTFGGYNYGVPLGQKNDPINGRPSRSPNFRGPNPFTKDSWSGFMTTWLQTEWVPNHPGLTVEDFKIPTAPALAFDWYIGGMDPPHSMGTGINVLYTDGHVRFHRQQGGVGSTGIEQIRVWYDLSIKQ